MPQPSRIKNALLVGAVILATLGWWLSRPSATRPETRPETAPETPLAAVVATPSGQPSPAPLGSPKKITRSYALPTLIQNQIRACLNRAPHARPLRSGDGASLDTVLQDLTVRSSARAPEESVVNLQVRRSSGELESLHVEPATPDETPRRGSYLLGKNVVRVFKTDAEGLPIPIEFPQALRKSSLVEISHGFVGADPVVYRERRYRQSIGNGVTVQVDEENGHAVEVQINSSAGALGCSWAPDTHEPSCSCHARDN